MALRSCRQAGGESLALGWSCCAATATVILLKSAAASMGNSAIQGQRQGGGCSLDAELICYCFGYTVADIKVDAIRNGRSTILERIIREKHDGACRCAETNPTGR